MKVTQILLPDGQPRIRHHLHDNLATWHSRHIRRYLLEYLSTHTGNYELIGFDNLQIDIDSPLCHDGNYDGLLLAEAVKHSNNEIALRPNEFLAHLLSDFLARTPRSMLFFDHNLKITQEQWLNWFSAELLVIGQDAYHFIRREMPNPKQISDTILDGGDQWFVGAAVVLNQSAYSDPHQIRDFDESIEIVTYVFTVALDRSGYALWRAV